MNEKQLEAFVYLARNGNFVRGAEMLYFDSDADEYLTPETLMYRVRTLEEELGISLYKKAPGVSQVTLTREGHLFLREAIDLHQRMRGLRSAFSLSSNRVLAFCATELVILHRLVEPLRRYNKANPKIRIELSAQSPAGIEASVRDGLVDFGLATHPPDDPGLDYHLWKRSKLVAVTPRGHALAALDKVTLEQLAEHPLILLTHDLSRRDDRANIDMAFRRKKISHHEKIVLETSNSEIITCYVEAGLGIGIVSDTSMVDTRRRIEKVEIDADFPASEVGLLLRKEKVITPTMRAFFEILGDSLSEWVKTVEVASQ